MERLLQDLQLDPSQYALGHTLVFLKAGVLGHLENMRMQLMRCGQHNLLQGVPLIPIQDPHSRF